MIHMLKPRRQPSGCLLSLLLFIFSPQVFAANATPHVGLTFELDSLNLSEPVSIKANFDDWNTNDFKAGERIFTKQTLFSGAKVSGTELGVTYRYHYYLNFSPDTAYWHYQEQNDTENASVADKEKRSDILDIYLDANNVSADGYYIAQDFSYKSLTTKIRLSYLALRQLTFGIAEGQYDPFLDLGNQTQLSVDYAYSEDTILDREVDKPKGHGWVVDFAITWRSDDHEIALNIDEAYSTLKWKAAPASLIYGNLVDLDIRDDAALQFTEFYSKVDQTLPKHSKLHYHYNLHSNWRLGAEREQLGSKHWNRILLNVGKADAWQGQLSWEHTDSLIGLRLHHRHFNFYIESDSTDYEQSRVLNFGMDFHLTF